MLLNLCGGVQSRANAVVQRRKYVNAVNACDSAVAKIVLLRLARQQDGLAIHATHAQILRLDVVKKNGWRVGHGGQMFAQNLRDFF